MNRVSNRAGFQRKLPLLVAISVLGVAFSLASLRTDQVQAEEKAAIAEAQFHFNDIVAEKRAQIEGLLTHTESITRGIYAATTADSETALDDYLASALIFDENAALEAVAVVSTESGRAEISQIKTPGDLDPISLAGLIYVPPRIEPGSNLQLLKDPIFTDNHLLVLSYRPSADSRTAAMTVFDGNALLGPAIGGGHDLRAALTAPTSEHTFLGYVDSDGEASPGPDPQQGRSGHQQNQALSKFDSAVLFDQQVEISVYGDPWTLEVAVADSFLKVPENGEADAIVGAGVLLALLGYFVALQVIRSRDRDRQQLDLAQLGLTETEQRLIHGFDQSPIGVAELQFDGRTVRANGAMTGLLGLQPGELDDEPITPYLALEYQAAHKVRLQHLQKQGFGATKTEVQYIHSDGSTRTVRENISVIPESSLRGSYVLLQSEDVTEERKARDELSARALRDELTGIPNRALFSDRLEHELSAQGPTAKTLAVMFVDIDHFKVVNDSLGHSVGDALITEMALRLQDSVRDCDTVARFGGDEFVLLTSEVSSEEEATRLADEICQVMREPYDLGNRQIRATVSIGVTLSFNGADVEALLRNADIALYKAKDNGRDRAELFSTNMHTDAVARQSLAEDLRVAIRDNQLRCWYQPIISATNGDVKGVEALIRWEHPTRGLLSPFHFLGIAAEIGLNSAIDDWVMKAASTQLQQWSEEFEDVKRWSLSVNTTPKHLLEDGYSTGVKTILKESRLAPRRLIIEVTEDSMLDDLDTAAEVVKELATEGVRVAIDDFGTGYSSMSMLATLKVNQLKIDASFVQSMRESHESASIVETCISLAQSLRIPVVAEGVEELEDLAAVIEAGADLIQGYVYSRPQSGSVISDILLQHAGNWPQTASSPNKVQSA